MWRDVEAVSDTEPEDDGMDLNINKEIQNRKRAHIPDDRLVKKTRHKNTVAGSSSSL